MPITKAVQKLEAYTPGEQPKARNVVKLNTNENPYPPSPKCAKALKTLDLDRLRRYPDPVFTELRKELARLNDTKIDNIFVGNGSDEVLSVAARTFVEDDESIGSLDPSYSLYKTLADIRNVPWIGFPHSNIRTLKHSNIQTLKHSNIQTLNHSNIQTFNHSNIQTLNHSPTPSLFLWTNPNAPTGTFVSKRKIAAFAKKFPGVVIIDEAYADFAKENCMDLAVRRSNRNILVMRTFSKSYSLAGLRVGYCVGPADLIAAMYKVKDSYNIDAVAQAVALAAVKDQRWMRRNVAKIVKTRARFVAELEKRGWDVLPSEANFVFAKPPADQKAAEIFERLKKHNIYVRYFSAPKTADRLRITIGTDAEMKTLLAQL